MNLQCNGENDHSVVALVMDENALVANRQGVQSTHHMSAGGASSL